MQRGPTLDSPQGSFPRPEHSTGHDIKMLMLTWLVGDRQAAWQLLGWLAMVRLVGKYQALLLLQRGPS